MNKKIGVIGLLFLTIIITRIFTIYIFDPNIVILGLELHHIYYGILLGIITLIFFKGEKVRPYLFIISIGLIIDELEYALRGFGNHQIYTSTWPSAIILAFIISALIYQNEKGNRKHILRKTP